MVLTLRCCILNSGTGIENQVMLEKHAGGVMCKMLSVKQRVIREAVVTLPIIYRVYTMILNAHSIVFPATLF